MTADKRTKDLLSGDLDTLSDVLFVNLLW